MGRVIAITSGKGGTGKTTACAAISSCLAALGHRTLALDCDIGLRNLDISLGMSDFTVSDLADVAEGRMGISEAVHEHPELQNLFFLAAPLYKPPGGLDLLEVSRLIRQAREEFDFMVIDSPAGLGSGFELATCYADEAIVVATADPASVRNAARAREQLDSMGVTEVRLLLNRVDKPGWAKYRTTADDIVDAVGARLLGIIRHDGEVPASASGDKLLILYSRGGAAMDFLNVARRLLGEDIPLH